jgi:hypothetical protein
MTLKVVNNAKSGSVVLMHRGGFETPDALQAWSTPWIVPSRTATQDKRHLSFRAGRRTLTAGPARRTGLPRVWERDSTVIATSTTNDTLSIPLDGLIEAQLRIAFGGGELTLREAQPGILIAGSFEGGVIERSSGRGTIDLEPTGRPPFIGWRPLRWDVGVTAEIPVDLRLQTGANRSTIDLTSLRIRRLDLRTGASETHVRLPEAGQTSVRIACGLASVIVAVPTGVAASIHGSIALGSTNVDEKRFPRVFEGWASPDYETAVDHVDIAIEGGLGSVQIG